MSRFARITEDPEYDTYHDDTTDWAEQLLDPEDPNQLQENNNKDFFANS